MKLIVDMNFHFIQINQLLYMIQILLYKYVNVHIMAVIQEQIGLFDIGYTFN